MAAFVAPRWAMQQRLRDVGTAATLLVLANHARAGDHTCFPSQALIAQITGQSERQVRRQIAFLIALGLVSVVKRIPKGNGGSGNLYRLHVDVIVDISKQDCRRALLSGEPVTGEPHQDSTVSQRTVEPHQGTVTGPLTPSKNSQSRNPQEEPPPSGEGILSTRGLYDHLAAALAANLGTRIDSSDLPEAAVMGSFKRLLATGDSHDAIRQRIDRYVAAPAAWRGDSRWKDFFSDTTQARLRHTAPPAGNGHALFPEPILASDLAGLTDEEAIARIRWSGLSPIDRAAAEKETA